MYTVRIENLPKFCKVDEEKSVIEIYAPKDFNISSSQMVPVTLDNLILHLNDDVVGIPFLDTKYNTLHSLYYPKGFILLGVCNNINIYLTSWKRTQYQIKITKGMYLGSYKFMTSQFYRLNCRKDGSDRGLRSAKINFEIYGKNNNCR
jgi:hypothetical protein